MRRRFGRRERNELYMASNGKCSQCGVDLDETWHADHVIPFVAGGETNLRNGQALCRACNLRKGATMHQQKDAIALRPHQAEMANKVKVRLNEGKRTIVGDIFPGSGKTAGYLNAANMLFREGRIDAVVIVVPRINLARQVEQDWDIFRPDYVAPRMGPIVKRSNNAPLFRTVEKPKNSKQYHDQFGYVTTYDSLVAGLDLHRQSLAGRRYLLIVDESHQLALDEIDDEKRKSRTTKSAGAVMDVGERAEFIISVTGTPIREDSTPILYGEYSDPDADGFRYLKSDVKASYRDGVRGGYLRRFDFEMVNGTGRYREMSGDTGWSEKDIDLRSMESGLHKILMEPGYWQEMVDRTVERVQAVQRIDKRLCGLIGAYNQRHASEIQAYLKKRHPLIKSVKAVSDESESHQRLEEFRSGGYDILITVAMAHVGFDHKPICVVCLLNGYRSKGWVTQFVGRGLRVLPGVDVPLHGICPDDPKAVDIFESLRQESEDGIRDQFKPRGPREPHQQHIGYTEYVEVGETIVLGNDVTVAADEFQRIDSYRRQFGLEYAASSSLKQFVDAMTGVSESQASASVAVLDRPLPDISEDNEGARRSELASICKKINAARAKVVGYDDWQWAQRRLIEICGGSIVDDCGADEIERRFLVLPRLWAEASNGR